jgi:signal recognition particle subunit SRP54
MRQVRRMGPMSQVLGMIPGFRSAARAKDLTVDEGQLDRIEAIIQSMTPGERRHPEIINGSRRQRIARGSGTTVQDVNRLLKQYAQLRKMMRQLKGMEGRMPKLRLPGLPPGRG